MLEGKRQKERLKERKGEEKEMCFEMVREQI